MYMQGSNPTTSPPPPPRRLTPHNAVPRHAALSRRYRAVALHHRIAQWSQQQYQLSMFRGKPLRSMPLPHGNMPSHHAVIPCAWACRHTSVAATPRHIGFEPRVTTSGRVNLPTLDKLYSSTAQLFGLCRTNTTARRTANGGGGGDDSRDYQGGRSSVAEHYAEPANT